MLLDKPLKLCAGPGNGENEACLLTAVSMLMGDSAMSDSPSCVCPLLRGFIPPVNDGMSQLERETYLSDLPWKIIGTNTGDMNILRQRTQVFIDAVNKEESNIASHYESLHCSRFALFVFDGKQKSVRRIPNHRVLEQLHLSNKTLFEAGLFSELIGNATVVLTKIKAWDTCREVILKICEIGNKTPIEPAMSAEDLFEALV